MNNTTALSTTHDAEIVDETTGEIMELPPNDDPLFTGIAAAPFSETAAKVLTAPVDESLVRIRPDGIVYLPGVMYRRILNDAFRPGAWALRPIEARVIKEDGLVVYTAALVVMGRFVSQATGEHRYVASNGNSSYATSLESAKTDCLGRCCKDLGIATELWDNEWVEGWKERHAVSVWCENIGKSGKDAGSVKKFWRKTNAPPFDYPWKESEGNRSQSSQASQRSQSSDALSPDVAPSEGDEWRTHTMSFGKHRGVKLGEMEDTYVDWLTENWTPKGMPGDQHIVAMIGARRERKKAAMVDARNLTGGTIPPRSETPKRETAPRPWSALDTKAALLYGAERLATKEGDGPSTAADHKRLGTAITNLGKELGPDAREKIMALVFGVTTAKDMTRQEINSIVRWVGSTKDETDSWIPNEYAVEEGKALVALYDEQVAKDAKIFGAIDATIGEVIGDGLDAMGQPIGDATEEVAS